MRVLGVVGWSGAGKTTLIEGVLPHLVGAGMRVSTVKHAHAGFEMDRPGKDSWRHRAAGAGEVMLAGARRWALLHEVEGEEPGLEELIGRLAPCDLVLVEGWKGHPYPKIEVYRRALGKAALWPEMAGVMAVASDGAVVGCPVPVLALDEPALVAAWIRAMGHKG